MILHNIIILRLSCGQISVIAKYMNVKILCCTLKIEKLGIAKSDRKC